MSPGYKRTRCGQHSLALRLSSRNSSGRCLMWTRPPCQNTGWAGKGCMRKRLCPSCICLLRTTHTDFHFVLSSQANRDRLLFWWSPQVTLSSAGTVDKHWRWRRPWCPNTDLVGKGYTRCRLWRLCICLFRTTRTDFHFVLSSQAGRGRLLFGWSLQVTLSLPGTVDKQWR